MGICKPIGLLATKQERLFFPAKLIIRGGNLMSNDKMTDLRENLYAEESVANELLKSESFVKLSDVSRELSYTKPSLFSGVYFQQFGRKPAEDFISSNY